MLVRTYSIGKIKFWQAYITTMRPYLLFISGAAGLVGLAFIGDQQSLRVLVAFIPLFLSYGFGQALTDCFQTDTDAISSPYRPLVKGDVSRRQVLLVSLVGLTTSALLLTYINPKILILGILAILGLLTYTYFKRAWWGGPPWNAWIVALLPVMGRFVDTEYQIGTSIQWENARSLAFCMAVGAVFFGYANFVIMGYFKDISADRRTGYRTFPVVFGWKPAALYSDLTGAGAAVLTGFALFLCGMPTLPGVIVFAVAVSINLFAQIKIHRTRDEGMSHGPIANVVRAFVLYCLAIIVNMQHHWIIFIALFYLCFELTLRYRPEETQV